MIRVLWLVGCLSALSALSACGDPGTPGSLTAHMDGRINNSVSAVSQTK